MIMMARLTYNQYYSGEGGELRACVGLARFTAIGVLFGEPQIEMIGVQNVVNAGVSGAPLISASDDPESFMGIGNNFLECEFTIANNTTLWGPTEALGTKFTSVDHPLVIAMYLHLIIPLYPYGISFLILLFIQTTFRRRSSPISGNINGFASGMSK